MKVCEGVCVRVCKDVCVRVCGCEGVTVGVCEYERMHKHLNKGMYEHLKECPPPSLVIMQYVNFRIKNNSCFKFLY